MKIERKWAMPSHNTFLVKPIGDWVRKKLENHFKKCDPFARNCVLGYPFTNDINPGTKAVYHMKALEFLYHLTTLEGFPDMVIFDPPYTLRQVKECYEGFGFEFTHQDSQNAIRWSLERDLIAKHQKQNDGVLSFGYTSTCMGKKRGYEIQEILLVSHGPAHNDTICVYERKK